MAEFKVHWTIDVDTECHEAAGMLALEIMRDPKSIASVFTVADQQEVEVVMDCNNGVCLIIEDGRSTVPRDGISAAELEAIYSPDGGGEHPMFRRADWRVAVEHDETINGYWNWLQHQVYEANLEGAK